MGNSNWRVVNLKEVADVNPELIDKSWPHKHISYIDISSVGQGYLAEKPKVISLADAPSRAKRMVRLGDTIVSTVRPNRRSMLYASDPSPDWIVSTGFAVIRPKQDLISPRYLYSCVFNQSFTDYLVAHEIGAAYPAVSVTDISNAPIPLFPRVEQEAIACILGALDDKIELNRQMCKTLEGIAQAIFKSWFVDFDPVHAKAAGKQPVGLKPEIAALFPDSFVDSELGEIPKGWRVTGLDSLGTFLNGLALQKYPPLNDDSLPVVKIAQLRTNDTTNSDRASANIGSEYIVNDGDILFSWSGSLECVIWFGGAGALNQHLFRVTSAQYSKWFLYMWIHRHLPEFRHIAAGKATTMGHIQRHHLEDAKVLVPPTDLLSMQDQIMEPLIDAIVSRSLENRKLTDLRDTLLPKLISGELRVKDAERIAGRSV